MNRMIVTLPIDWVATGNDNAQGAEGMRWDDERAVGELLLCCPPGFEAGHSPKALIGCAEYGAGNLEGGTITERASGPCAFGSFGAAVARTTDGGRLHVWVLSDGWDFILATHTCDREPDPAEIQGAQAIVDRVLLEDVPEAPLRRDLKSWDVH
jgi:hypothetical protein